MFRINNKTVLENIMLAPVTIGCKKARRHKIDKTPQQIKDEARETAMRLLKRIGLEEKANVYPSTLSGGQKQRIAIAGILAMKPECIILDEPTAMLDPRGRNEVMKTLGRLNKEEHMTVVHITHYMEEAALADRVIVMDKGKVVMDGSPREVFVNVEKLKSLGLDVPPMTELAYRLRKQGIDIDADILSVEEMVDALCRLN